MNEEPTFFSTLNAIANGERRGFMFLNAWSQKTRDQALASMLKHVAIREAEHAASFEKRISELGRELIETADDGFQETMAVVNADISDTEKFEKLGIGLGDNDEDGDHLLQLLADKSIDPATGSLIGRFIAEERDSERILHQAYQHSRGMQPAQPATPTTTLEQVSSQLAQLAIVVADLQNSQK